ncbi:MAG: hypothetical protein ACREGC_04480, partial [Minisyncoccia bacterium]
MPPVNQPELAPTPAQQPATPPPTPVAQEYKPPGTTNTSPVHNLNTPNVIVMQWLTYAFWGWTALSLSILTGIVLANFINKADMGSFTPYAIAAVLVLLPISFVCDYFYSKHEPGKNTGSAMVVMVIHAVLFALFGVGALIGIVFSLVQFMT